ncbi:hypothetical protein GGH96_002157 [Coemansia sp. RSA 1972]|nr:hypothetical protein GGH96_002157 [Coemansia sp. RSA 1972]
MAEGVEGSRTEDIRKEVDSRKEEGSRTEEGSHKEEEEDIHIHTEEAAGTRIHKEEEGSRMEVGRAAGKAEVVVGGKELDAVGWQHGS